MSKNFGVEISVKIENLCAVLNFQVDRDVQCPKCKHQNKQTKMVLLSSIIDFSGHKIFDENSSERLQ